MSLLKFGDYEGTAEVDIERQVCRGKILFIDDLVTYEAESPRELQKAFEEAVADYLATCIQLKRQPLKPLKGQFNVRVPPQLHRDAARRAAIDNTSLNDVVVSALQYYINGTAEITHNHNVELTLQLPVDQKIESFMASTAGMQQWRTASVGHH